LGGAPAGWKTPVIEGVTPPVKAAEELKVFLLLFLQKKKILFFSEEKNQKTFDSLLRRLWLSEGAG
jgi:hypothetical protein